MPPSLTTTVVPTGGAIVLVMESDSPMTLTRAVSGSATSQTLYSGEAIPLFIDTGDGLPQPLTAGTAYVYSLTDTTGTTVSAPLLPGGAIIAEPDGLTALIIRLIQAGITNLVKPDGIDAPEVSNAMPISGFPPMPFVVINLDLIQQENVPIGQNVIQPDGENIWTQASYAKKIWRISVLSRNAAERDFYRDALVAIFQSLLGSVFTTLGANMSHRYQAASGQTADEYQGKSPGFFFADVMMEVLGVFNTSLQTSFGLIEAIRATTVYPDGNSDTSQVGTPT